LWLLLVSLVLHTLPVWAQRPATGGWQYESSLRGQLLQDVAQAPDQLLWLATDEGAYRYDGPGQLVPLNTLRRGGAPLPPVFCHHLLATPDGQLWLGTAAGAFRFSPAGVLRALPLPAPGQPSQAISSLALAPDGRHVWVGQDRVGVRRYTLAGEAAGPLLPEPEQLREAWPAPDGSLWVSIRAGRIRHFSADGQQLGEWQFPGRDLRPVLVPGTGRVWLLSTQRLYRPDPAGRLTPGPAWSPAGRGEHAYDLVRQDSTLALFTADEVVQLGWQPRPEGGPALRPRFSVAPPPLDGTPSWQLAFNSRLRLDAAGRWWVFATGYRSTWTRAAAPAFFQALPGPGGQPYSVRSTSRLPDGRLLVSTYKGFLVQAADSPRAPLRPWHGSGRRLGGGSRVSVLMGLVPAQAGPRHEEWLAASDFNFLRLHPGTGRVTPLPTPGLGSGMPLPLGLARDPAPDGLVWGVGSTGLYYYDARAAYFRPYRPAGAPASAPPPLAGQVLEDVWPDGRGHLWLATPAGVVRLSIATGAQQLFGPGAPAGPRRAALSGARCLAYDKARQRLWVGSRTQGLGFIDLRTEQARLVLGTANGLPHAHVASLLAGPQGALWLGTYAGLVRYQPASGALAVYTTADGLSSDEFNARAAYADSAMGSLLMGGVVGLHRLYPAQLAGVSRNRPRLVLTALTPLDAHAAADSSRPHYRLAADPAPALALAPGSPVVDLHLTLSNVFDAEQARFAYRIAGWLGGRWLPLGTTPVLRLQGLPAGRYEVEIRGETTQGLPAANTLRLPLTVTAEWWQHPATWAAGLALALLAMYGWLRLRQRQAQRESQLRARLAADLHDEVGALLTRVAWQADLANELRDEAPELLASLAANSRAAASTVRDIIWSVDTGADTLEALVDRIRDYLDSTARATGWRMTLDTHGLPADLTKALPPAVRQHSYLIFKEAVTNALRHAPDGHTLSVRLDYAPPLLTLTVTNDGRGALPAARAGQGLRNMRQRAALLNADLATGPRPAGGWQVRLRVPV